MKSQVARRLRSLEDEIRGARTELAIARDELAARRARSADLWARALVSETPVTDRAYGDAERERRRVEERVAERESRLLALMQEEAQVTLRLHARATPNLEATEET